MESANCGNMHEKGGSTVCLTIESCARLDRDNFDGAVALLNEGYLVDDVNSVYVGWDAS